MPRALKIVLIVVGCLGLFVLTLAGAGWYWWSTHGTQLIAAARESHDRGLAFGQTTDERGCLEQAVLRYKANPGMTPAVTGRLFLVGCFKSSSPTAGFCDGVPAPDALIALAVWQAGRCANAGMSDSYCAQIFNPVPRHCASKRSVAGR